MDTDEGITGWGEVTTYPGPVANRAVAAYIDEIGEWLRGEDPSHIEAIWHKIFRAMTYVGTRGATTAAISAIDIALWDIRGKVLGQPIYKLLGGPVRDRIALYCHPYGTTSPESDRAPAAKEIKAAGFKAFKMDPMIHNLHVGNASYLDGELSAEAEAKALDILAAAREAVGPAIRDSDRRPRPLQCAHGRAPGQQDGRVQHPLVRGAGAAGELEGAQAGARSRSRTPICVGERLHTRWEFVPIFENGLADFVMPDVTWTGGISELKKIATMAEAYYIPISPHDASGPINVMAGAQVMMTVPNFYKLEVPSLRFLWLQHSDRPAAGCARGLSVPDGPARSGHRAQPGHAGKV